MPQKVVLPFHEEKNIFSILVENLLRYFPATQVLLATTENESDDILALEAAAHGIDSFRGDEQDVLKRFIDAADSRNAELLVRVCADNPFLLADSIQPLLDEMKRTDADYVSYKDATGTPVIKTHWGLFAEVVKTTALRKVQEQTAEPLYHEHVTNFIYQHPQHFRVRLMDLPAAFSGRENYRFTLDTPEDFQLLQSLYLTLKTSSGNGPYTAAQLFAELDRQGNETVRIMREQIARNAK